MKKGGAPVQPTKVGSHALQNDGAREDKKDRNEKKKRADADARRRARAEQARRAEIDRLEARIAECEQAIRNHEQQMAAPGFYDNRALAQPVIDQHQSLMWQVGELMRQWEELQASLAEA
jgi:hypothetical protein